MPKKLPPLTRHAVTAPTEETGTRLPGARLMPIDLIRPNPWQPRQHADPERMGELIADVAERGILEPIIVRPMDDARDERYQVVAGERRYRAAVAGGLTSVPVIVRQDMTEAEAREASLVENLLREDLDIEDEARFIKALYEEKKSLRAVGEAIHKSYQYVNRRLKLLDDPGALLAYREGLINLDYLIASHTAEPGDVEMEMASQAEGGEPDEDGEEAVTERNNEETAVVEEVRFYRSKSAYKPFHKLHLHVRRLSPSEVREEERPRLRRAVHELITELTLLEQALEGEPAAPSGTNSDPGGEGASNTEIELEGLEGSDATWAVHHTGKDLPSRLP
jgi:ParB/RepB/Spo0J family partition protein